MLNEIQYKKINLILFTFSPSSKKIRTMRLKILFSISFFVLTGLTGRTQTNDQETILKTFHSISSNELLKYAEELSSEKYKGRLSGSPDRKSVV